jgi:hypothetical protein
MEAMLYGRRDGQHRLQDSLQGHRMTADAAEVEEIAITLPFALIEPDLMVIIVAAKRKAELVELKTIRFLGVPLGLFDFSNHPVVH